jgi:hypothetical protein
LGCFVDVAVDLSHVARDQPLQPIGFRNEPAEFLFVDGGDFGLGRLCAIKRIPIAGSERLLDTG